MNKFRLFFACLLFMCLHYVNASVQNNKVQPLDTVILKLKWQHQFQFAGYYAAIEKGFYKELGLHVKLVPPVGDEEVYIDVVNGDVNFGIGTSDLLLTRNLGYPVVLLANIFQHSPYTFLTLQKDGTENIHDIAGEKIMLEKQALELVAYLKKEQIETDEYTTIPHSYSPKDLLDGNVFAISAYITDEPFTLLEKGVKYNVFSPRSVGIDFYGDVLFTSEDQISKHPTRVANFVEASLKGWSYALNNSDEIIDIIYNKYSKRHSIEHLKYEYHHTKRLIMPDVVPVGYINKERWQRIGEIFAYLNMLPDNFEMDGFFYQKVPSGSHRYLYYVLSIILVVLLIISLIAIRFSKLNNKLKIESRKTLEREKELVKLEEQHRHLAEYAPYAIIITEINDGSILFLNDEATKVLKLGAHYIENKSVVNFYVNPGDRNTLRLLLENQGYVKNHELYVKDTSGKQFWVLVSSIKMWFNKKEAIFTSFIDISAQKKMLSQLKTANSSKDLLFSIISHDLKGPLGTLNQLLRHIKTNFFKLEKDRLHQLVLSIAESSQKTYDLVDYLLLWARSQKNEIRFSPKKSSFKDCIETVLDSHQVIAEKKQVKLISNCTNELIFIFDKPMLLTVLRNLVSNSIKFSEVGGKVIVNAKIEGANLICSVVDDGIGMDESVASNLFKFDSVKQSMPGTNGEKGYGLGLMLCTDFIDKHNGTIKASSRIGEGSEICFSIPSIFV